MREVYKKRVLKNLPFIKFIIFHSLTHLLFLFDGCFVQINLRPYCAHKSKSEPNKFQTLYLINY